MNRTQKILGFIAIGLFFVSVLGAPWRMDYSSPGSGNIRLSYVVYNPVFSAPVRNYANYRVVQTLLWQPLLFTWIAIAIAYAGLFFLVRSKQGPT